MSTVPYQNPHHESSAFAVSRGCDDIRRVMTSAHATVDQVRIFNLITAYNNKIELTLVE